MKEVEQMHLSAVQVAVVSPPPVHYGFEFGAALVLRTGLQILPILSQPVRDISPFFKY